MKTNVEEMAAELEEWERELTRLQGLLPLESLRDRLKQTDIPTLERLVEEQEALLPEVMDKVEKVKFHLISRPTVIYANSDRHLNVWKLYDGNKRTLLH